MRVIDNCINMWFATRYHEHFDSQEIVRLEERKWYAKQSVVHWCSRFWPISFLLFCLFHTFRSFYKLPLYDVPFLPCIFKWENFNLSNAYDILWSLMHMTMIFPRYNTKVTVSHNTVSIGYNIVYLFPVIKNS